MLAIIDYNAGNQTSVRRALEHLKIPCKITNNPDELFNASGVIFPGVGAAGQAMDNLKSRGMDKAIQELIASNKPILGVCIGCQILLDKSAENETQTLGFVKGQCLRFSPDLKDENAQKIRIPHMGWNKLELKQKSPLFHNISPDAEFYFVHSYFVKPPQELVLATTFYGQEFCSVYGRKDLWAVQFHPEKSGRPGLQLLQNFYDYCVGGLNA
ncbi:imidazole glycerol phosphate synthase subunit HisH [Desulfovibrio litoralis]|uniref:Imidazole glycerol phosphate synthase subunit HisH n=1 Tax=Desulfovibrio litoralis DSM 11393 TaxID=1121455 RepID=A0A1M7TFT4_9BACT|nr:imidazole glycerol phosphate synthase subunit HisH [Desulfovibrio litoralis]SHN69629.1 imidazole glycerol phosphate synthase subunit hisH [Desulfovibrio litoralis DSM 11393]